VVVRFASAGRVGVVRFIAEKAAERYAKGRCTGKLRGNIAIQKKAKRPAGCMKKQKVQKKMEFSLVMILLHPPKPVI